MGYRRTAQDRTSIAYAGRLRIPGAIRGMRASRSTRLMLMRMLSVWVTRWHHPHRLADAKRQLLPELPPATVSSPKCTQGVLRQSCTTFHLSPTRSTYRVRGSRYKLTVARANRYEPYQHGHWIRPESTEFLRPASAVPPNQRSRCRWRGVSRRISISAQRVSEGKSEVCALAYQLSVARSGDSGLWVCGRESDAFTRPGERNRSSAATTWLPTLIQIRIASIHHATMMSAQYTAE
jgi:hypothetical protein